MVEKDLRDFVKDSFEGITQEMIALRKRKNADYGDAFMTFYDDYKFVAIACDLGRKYERVRTFAKGKELKVTDETIEDTLRDIAVVALNAIVWLRARKKK
jgi:hypothetical protein